MKLYMILGILFLASCTVEPEVIDTIPTTNTGDAGPLGSYFNDQIISKGVEKIGQPIEGFDAFLLKRAFPGLKDEDFNNVEALLGTYKYVNNELIFVEKSGGLVHSAAQTISDIGMGTLMDNSARRLGNNITNMSDIDNLIESLE